MVYMGSKRRIAKYILPIILENRTEGQWYVETFCGGCNSINKVDGNRIASDNNKYLIALYKALQEGWQPKEYYTKEEYQGTTAYKTGAFNHELFWQWCRDKKAEGHTIFISEYNAPEDFKCVWQMEIKDTLSTKNTTIKTEKLFTI